MESRLNIPKDYVQLEQVPFLMEPPERRIASVLTRDFVVSAYKAVFHAMYGDPFSIKFQLSPNPAVEIKRVKLEVEMQRYDIDIGSEAQFLDPDLFQYRLDQGYLLDVNIGNWPYTTPAGAEALESLFKRKTHPTWVDCVVSAQDIVPPTQVRLRFDWPDRGRRGLLRYASILTGNYRGSFFEEATVPTVCRNTNLWFTEKGIKISDYKRYTGNLTMNGVNQWTGLEIDDDVGEGRKKEIWYWNDQQQLSSATHHFAHWDVFGRITRSEAYWKDPTQLRYPVDEFYGKHSIEGYNWGDQFSATYDGVKFMTMWYSPDNNVYPWRWYRALFDRKWREQGEERRKQVVMPMLGLQDGDVATTAAFHRWVKRKLDESPLEYPQREPITEALRPLYGLTCYENLEQK